MRTAVIGAGISGLSSALLLTEAGHHITIFARAFAPHITSSRAAAFWLPYHIRNDRRGIEWCRASYEAYLAFSEERESGISMQRLVKLVATDIRDIDRSWKEFMPAGSFEPIPPEALPQGYQEGDTAMVPLIETQVFLPWLHQRLLEAGVQFAEREINHFEELDSFDLIVNCSGLGARQLCGDTAVIPYRGQVALLSPRTGLPIFLDNEKPRYIVPRKDCIVIGGTYEENVWEETTEPETIQYLLKKAFEIYPELEEQQFLGSWCGLRPYRAEVRLAREGNIIHNYGHGGSGYTLAFGCSADVVKLATEL